MLSLGCLWPGVLYREAPPQKGTIFRRQVYEGVGISLVEVYGRVQNLSFRSVKSPKKGKQKHFRAVKKSRNIVVLLSFIYILKLKRQCIYSS